ncbi:MAG: aminodeoxychorismate/anthranilate synthase component II [bacterium]|nr:aminodeoxychorismate/anthranilate synthase component II [bacterium]
MILVIDNYDSFTYNLVQYVGKTGAEVKVVRNDKITIEDIKNLEPAKIIISPGPGHPSESGICQEVIRRLGVSIPILGVCLGHQTIGLVFGAEITNAEKLFHGKTSRVIHDSRSIFTGLENPLTATRYHSLVIGRTDFPEELTITAETEDGAIMGVRHKKYPIEGVQFHPESILTNEGEKLIVNYLMK